MTATEFTLGNKKTNVDSGRKMPKCQEFMKKFWQPRVVECNTIKEEAPVIYRPLRSQATGSKYEGTWHGFKMNGRGTYTFPNGVIYEGEFEDGEFHGKGDLMFPNRMKIIGKWNKGVLVYRKIIFDDGLEYDEYDFEYCKAPDRRFAVEYKKGLQPTDVSFLTAEQPTRRIPDGFYDTGDGFFDPEAAVVRDSKMETLIRAPHQREQTWILDNCRKGPDVILGPCPELYEEWQVPELQLKRPPSPIAKFVTDINKLKTESIEAVHSRFQAKVLHFDVSSSSSEA